MGSLDAEVLPRRLEARAAECVDRDAATGELLEGVRHLMIGQARVERLLERLVSESAAGETDPQWEAALAEAEEASVDSAPPRSPGHAKASEPSTGDEPTPPFDETPVTATGEALRTQQPSFCFEHSFHIDELRSRQASKSAVCDVDRRMPAWFQNLKLREELKGSKEELEEEFTRQKANKYRGGAELSWALTNSGDSTKSHMLRWLPVLSPSSLVRLCFDVISLIVLSYDMTSVPYFLAFETDREIFTWFSYASISYWTLDILVNFRTGFYANGDLELGARKVAVNYLSGPFVIDASVLALDVLDILLKHMQAAGRESNSFKLMRIFKVSRLMRLTGVLRLRRLRVVVQRLMAQRATNMMRMLFFVAELCSFIAMFLWLNHLLACLWVFLGRMQQENSDTGVTWLDQMTGDQPYSSYGDGYQYSTSLHWAMTQMTPGSMQVFPQNTSERVFNIACLVAGLVVFSTIISSISARVTNFRIQMQSVKTQMESLTEFLERTGVGIEVRLAVCKQASLRLHESRPLTVSNIDVLGRLPLSLRGALQLELCDPHLLGHPYLTFLAEADQTVWKEICLTCVDFSMLMRKDTLFINGAQASAMHFITMGNISYTLERAFRGIPFQSSEPVEVEKGRGLSEAALWCYWRHVGTAEVLKAPHCEVLSLQAVKLLRILTRDPLVALVTWAYARSFLTFLKNSTPPVCSPPTDLNLPFGVDETIASMPKVATICCGQVAIKVLRHQPETLLGSWILDVRDVKTEQLIKEVNSGGSTLLVTKRQGVVRCVPLVLIRLTRSDRRMLVRLRLIKKADGTPEATCKLPGGKQEAGEHPDDCLKRLLQEKLQPLASGVQVEGVEKHSEKENSRKFGVPTRYIRTVISADWACSADATLNNYLVPEPLRQIPRVMAHDSRSVSPKVQHRSHDPPEVYVKADVYTFPGGDVYAWLTQEEYVYFDSQRGQRSLFQWLSFLGMEDAPACVVSDRSLH